MQPEKKNVATFTGQYTLTENPCTTRPCLPGMAYALLVNDKYYFITVDGHLLSENRSWKGYTPELGDTVTITGTLAKKTDIYGKPFHTIEAASVHPA